MLSVTCEACGSELTEPGGLFIGPPLLGLCSKRHACVSCSDKIQRTFFSKSLHRTLSEIEEGRARTSLLSPPLPSEQTECNHGVTFDAEAARGLSSFEVRTRWPRLFGRCPLGCGYSGVYYASTEHYISGDW